MSMGGGGHSTTTTTQELSPEQRTLMQGVIPIAQNFLAHPPQQYPGTGIAGFTPQQLQAQQMTISAANSMLPQLQTLPGQINQMQQGYQGVQQGFQGTQAGLQSMQPGLNFLSSGDVLRPESNQYLRGAIEAASRPTIDMFREQIMPGITSDSLGMGGLGGTRQGIAEGIAGGKANQAVADIASSMSNTNYQAGLQAMLGGQQNQNANFAGQQQALSGQQGALGAQQNLAANMGGILSQQLLPAQLTEAVGAQNQMMNQQRLSEQVQRFVNQQMIPFSAAQDVAAMAFGMPGGTTRSESTGGQQGGGMGQQLLGGALSILPMLIGKSDRRLKKDIVRIGEENGLALYSFKYKGTSMEMIGFMADEVEELYPENVVVDVTGYKSVRYGAML